MKVIGINGKEYTWKLKRKQSTNPSQLHQSIRHILKSLYPFQIIIEECQIPGSKLYFDFVIPSQLLCIEADGIQHEKYIPFFHKDIVTFNRSCQRDLKKEYFCELNNLRLVRLKYNETEEQWQRKILGI